MNTTLNISLAGFSFIIEENAYQVLKNYLESLKSKLEPEEAQEVMTDIESRVVELLKEQLDKREVVNIQDVQMVISTIGKPEEMEDFDEETAPVQDQMYTPLYTREFFRDPVMKKIGGVCAGLAAYSGISITAMRVIWVVAFILLFYIHPPVALMVGFLYIALWIILPTAKSAADFLKMKGKPVNFQSLRSEITDAKNIKPKSILPKYNAAAVSQTGSDVGKIILSILGVFLLLIGVTFAITSLISISAYAGGSEQIERNIEFFTQNDKIAPLGFALLFLTCLIPSLLFIIGGIKLLSPKTKLKGMPWIFGGLVVLWFVVIGSLAGVGSQKLAHQVPDEISEENFELASAKDTLIVKEKDIAIPAKFKNYWDNISSDGKTIIKNTSKHIVIERDSTLKTPYLEIKKKGAEGSNFRKYQVPVELVGKTLYLPNRFSYPAEFRLNDSSVKFTLHIPKATVLDMKKSGKFKASKDEDEYDSWDANEEVNIGDGVIRVSSGKDSVIIKGNGDKPSIKVYKADGKVKEIK